MLLMLFMLLLLMLTLKNGVNNLTKLDELRAAYLSATVEMDIAEAAADVAKDKYLAAEVKTEDAWVAYMRKLDKVSLRLVK
jgi:hypothetical protein